MTAKIAKEWFRKNSNCVVSFHYRWSELSANSREVLSMPRTVTVNGHRAIFNARTAGRSEVSLVGVMASVDEVGRLSLNDSQGRHFVTYEACT